MSQSRNGSTVAHGQDDEGEKSEGEPPRKQQKLDLQPEKEKTADFKTIAPTVNIDDLPDEVMATILSFLSFKELTEIAQNVSTKWRRASHDPLVWRNMEYCVDWHNSEAEVLTTLPRVPQLRSLVMKHPVKAAVLRALSKNCKYLKRLQVANSQPLGYSLLNKLVMSCRNIQSLTIPHHLIVDERKAHILAQLLKLQSLEVIQKDMDGKSIYLRPFGDGCPELSRLDVSETYTLRIGDLKQFIEVKSQTLTHLALSWSGKNERCLVPVLKNCSSLTDLTLDDVSNNQGELLGAFTALSHLKNLSSLTLIFWHDRGLVDTFALKSSVFLHLKVLKITDTYLQNSVFVGICEECPNLKELHLTSCGNLTERDLRMLYRLRMLETLAFQSCNGLRGEALMHVAQVPNLRKLFLRYYDFRELKDGLPFILHINSLEVLSFTSIRYACFFHFDRIPETLTNLRVLKVKDCELDPRIPEQLKQQMRGLKIYSTD